MTARTYKVTMRVPLGERRGQMLFHEADETVNGTLDILGHSEPFSGWLSSDGRCELRGNIISAVRTIPYTAYGSVTNAAIKLTLRNEQGDLFYMTGEESHGTAHDDA